MIRIVFKWVMIIASIAILSLAIYTRLFTKTKLTIKKEIRLK